MEIKADAIAIPSLEPSLQKSNQQQHPIHPTISFDKQQKNNKSLLKDISSSVRTNPYLKHVFRQICKKSYRVGETFDKAMSAPTKMTLNKWMIFCKQFNLTEVITRKKLQQAFNKATDFKPEMNLQQFLTAVEIVQILYNKDNPHTYDDFVEGFLKLSCVEAYRLKINNFSINFPTCLKNHFVESSFTEKQRQMQLERQIIFKNKKRKRELILIKGMLPEHLYDEICQRKSSRKKKQSLPKLLNKSQVFQKQVKKSYLRPQDPQKKNISFHKFLTYSQRYQSQRQYTQKKIVPSRTQAFHSSRNNSVLIDFDSPKEITKETSQKHKAMSISSDESDQILKQHFLLQKKNKFIQPSPNHISNKLQSDEWPTSYAREMFR